MNTTVHYNAFLFTVLFAVIASFW